MIKGTSVEELAKRLADLVPGRVDVNKVGRYISLDVGRGSPKNAVGIHPSYVTFIAGEDLKRRVESAGFDIRTKHKKKHNYEQDKVEVRGVSIDSICQNEQVFRELIESSIQAIMRYTGEADRPS